MKATELNLKNKEAIEKEFKRIGVYPQGIEIMTPKFQFKIIKLKELDSRAANIIKQEMLSAGGEAALSKDAVENTGKATDVLLAGTLRQYKDLTEKLKKQPFGLDKIAEELDTVLKKKRLEPLKCGTKTLAFDKPLIMGVLNVTPDSFSDGGKYNTEKKAIEQAKKMIEEGTDIIDIGGESSRPGAEPVPEKEELERVIPVIKAIKGLAPISIDTYKPEVAEKALEAGACMLNDIKASDEMIELAAKHKVPIVLMHMKGTPKTMQKAPKYENVMDEVLGFLEERANKAKDLDVQCIIDPGIGFGKTTQNNLEIIHRLEEFKAIGAPILLGTSRKTFIGKITGLPPEERLEGTIASVVVSALNGANIIRVHDVKESKRALQITEAIKKWQEHSSA